MLPVVMCLAGSLLIIAGYFRFITDQKGHVPLNNYRLTGALNLVIRGLYDGSTDLLSRRWSKDAISCLLVYAGLILLFAGFKISS